MEGRTQKSGRLLSAARICGYVFLAVLGLFAFHVFLALGGAYLLEFASPSYRGGGDEILVGGAAFMVLLIVSSTAYHFRTLLLRAGMLGIRIVLFLFAFALFGVLLAAISQLATSVANHLMH